MDYATEHAILPCLSAMRQAGRPAEQRASGRAAEDAQWPHKAVHGNPWAGQASLFLAGGGRFTAATNDNHKSCGR